MFTMYTMILSKSTIAGGHLTMPHAIRLSITREKDRPVKAPNGPGKTLRARQRGRTIRVPMCVMVYEEDCILSPEKVRFLKKMGMSPGDMIRQTGEAVLLAGKQQGYPIEKLHHKVLGPREVRIGFTWRRPFADACSGAVVEFLVQSDIGQACLSDIIRSATLGAMAQSIALGEMDAEAARKKTPPPKLPSKRERERARKASQESYRKYMIEQGMLGGASKETSEAFVTAYIASLDVAKAKFEQGQPRPGPKAFVDLPKRKSTP